MASIDNEPRPRAVAQIYQCASFATGAAEYLPIPDDVPSSDTVWQVIQRRRTHRSFGQVSDASLGSLLWHACKASRGASIDGIERQHRPAPSAGAIHPITVVLQGRSRERCKLHVYDPHGHAVRPIDANNEECTQLRQYADEVLATQDGLLLWLLADFGKTAAVYQNAESLVWRDAGVLICLISVVCEALSLNCCPLGICGGEYLRNVFGCYSEIQGVGAIVVGSRK